MQLSDSVIQIKGVGEKAKQHLNKLQIETIADLLEHYPRDYDEWKPIRPIADVAAADMSATAGMSAAGVSSTRISAGELVAVQGTLSARPQMKIAGRLKILTAVLQDSSGVIPITWFNMPFLRNQLKMGTCYIMRGKVEEKNGVRSLCQPKIYTREEFYRQVGKLQPIYSLTAGLTNRAVMKALEQALKETEDLQEYLPQEIRKRQNLISYKKALQQIHFPANWEEMREGRRRLVFDELFLYSLALAYIKKKGTPESRYVLEEKEEVEQFIKELPFTLTNSQKEVYREIMSDLTGGYVMNRLLQGDVGSGKTIVAVLALYQTAKNGGQGAFMVPTEVLAGQHYQNLCRMLKDTGVKVGLLTGSLTAGQKRDAKECIASGAWDIVVGTHAMIQDNVNFKKLVLVITDEQHRFGVKQRESLFQKGKTPHTLAMSATPIPRTLALILYGDMNLSVIEERPADRLPIKNCVVNTGYRPQAYKFMLDQIRAGRQVYIICPMVDESDEMELENVTIYTEELRCIFPETVRIDCLHGKMKPAAKEQIMERFSKGETDILVSTTVIEVGIDVPNASVIMIENAERFGLAQLHQLRGRVGRGREQSYCILMTGREGKESRERLNVLANSNDGFHIAKEDLKMRGQGDLFGIRQSGDQIFRLADIFDDAALLCQAGEEAGKLMQEEIALLYKKNYRLKDKVSSYLGEVTL